MVAKQLKVSVLIAARNEEQHIGSCLNALLSQNFDAPYEILVGDDASDDSTAGIVKNTALANSKLLYHYLPEGTLTDMRGKVRVLHYLTQHARGQLYIFTDADTVVGSDWIATHVAQLEKATLSAGFTVSSGGSFFSQWQQYDWLINFKLVQWLVNATHSIGNTQGSACGNNMAIKAESLRAIGGFAAFKKSLVEDYALTKATIEGGGTFALNHNRKLLAKTAPAATLQQWLQQRQRWLSAALTLPLFIKGFFYVQVVWLWLLPLLLLLPNGGSLIATLLSFRLITSACLTLFLVFYYRLKVAPIALLLYPILADVLAGVSLVYYKRSSKITWRSRKY